MAKITLEEAKEIQLLPKDSIVELKIEECNVVTQQGQRGEWQKVEFKFKILGIQAIGDGSPNSDYDSLITEFIYGSVPFKLNDHPENKLRSWAEAIFRQDLGLGFELDTDMFTGRMVRGLTSQYEKRGSRDPQTGQPFKRHQVESLLPKGDGVATSPSTPDLSGPPPTGKPEDPWGWSGGDEPPF